MRLAWRNLLTWFGLGHRRTLADVWASNLLTESPCEGSISGMIRLDMQVQDLSKELEWI